MNFEYVNSVVRVLYRDFKRLAVNSKTEQSDQQKKIASDFKIMKFLPDLDFLAVRCVDVRDYLT